MQCQICQQQCNGAKGLGLHVNKAHGVNRKPYYDKYLRQLNEGVCIHCQGETTFESLGRGYPHSYCSKKCEAEHLEARRRDQYEQQLSRLPQEQIVECAICHKRFSRLSGLGSHIVRTHKISTQQYYDQYLKKDSKEGVCLECGKATYFQDMDAGYPNQYCSMSCNKAEAKRVRLKEEKEAHASRKSEHVTCRICRRKLIGPKGLTNHVRQQHGVLAQQYYDAYLRGPDEAKCSCGASTRFIAVNKGYHRYCSNDCYNKSDEHKAIVSATMSQLPGFLKGRPSHFKGTKQPLEHTIKIRKAHIKRAQEQCAKYGISFPTCGKDEAAFFDAISKIVEQPIIRQYQTPEYHFLDGYIESLQLAIEFDEPHHLTESCKLEDAKREAEIQASIPDIQFLRINQADWDETPYDVIATILEAVE